MTKDRRLQDNEDDKKEEETGDRRLQMRRQGTGDGGKRLKVDG